MRLVFLGPPGAGKGTMAVKTQQLLSVPHISTGDLFRYHVSNNTELGRKVKIIMERGDLVSDEITVSMVQDRLRKDDAGDGFIFDGFPRTISQAKAFSKVAELDYVINLQCSKKDLIIRLTGRRSCPVCGRIYHIEFFPPQSEGICDDDDATLQTRKDDTLDAVENRLKVYDEATSPLIDWYGDQNLLQTVDASAAPEEVFSSIKKLLQS